MPFLAVLSGRGLEIIRDQWGEYSDLLLVTLLFISAAALLFQTAESYSEGPLTRQEPFDDPYHAGEWLENNTKEGVKVYANSRWAPLANYSRRKVVPLYSWEDDSALDRVLADEGYLYLSRRAHNTVRLREYMEMGRLVMVRNFSSSGLYYFSKG